MRRTDWMWRNWTLQHGRTATIQQWAVASEWTRDTGGDKDANGAPVRVTTGIFAEMFAGTFFGSACVNFTPRVDLLGTMRVG